MRIISRTALISFWSKHPDAETPLRHWERIARSATWSSPLDVQSAFSKAKVVGPDRVRFDVGGGAFRLIVAFDFGRGLAFIKFVGTHAEYDRIDARTVSRF